MKDKANPLALYHQRQIENQATPVHLIGSDPLNIQTDSVIIEQGGATEVTLEAVEARLEAVESLLSGTLTTQLSGSKLVEQLTDDDAVDGTLTFSEAIAYVEVVNVDRVNWATFTVNDVPIEVPPDTKFGPGAVGVTASAEVLVTGSTRYIVSRYI